MEYYTRCPVCFQRVAVKDEYGDYNVFVKVDGKFVRKSEDRWFDPDWCIERHIKRNH